MPTFLIAPDSFKGSISAALFCQIAQQVILQRHPSATVVTRPLSDGGGRICRFICSCWAGRSQIHLVCRATRAKSES